MPTKDFPSASEHVTQETINRYADISGDYNPIHVDEEAAAASEFGGTIAHGPIALQTFFRSLTEWPTPPPRPPAPSSTSPSAPRPAPATRSTASSATSPATR